MNLLRAVAALVAVAALASACDDGTGDVPPYEEPTHYTKSSAAASPTNDPLTDPPKDETARQFIKRFIALGDHLEMTGDAKPFLAVSGPRCSSCRAYARGVRRIYRAGGSFDVKPGRVVAARHSGGNEWSFTVVTRPGSYVTAKGADTTQLSGGRTKYVAYVAKDSGAWLMIQWLRVKS